MEPSVWWALVGTVAGFALSWAIDLLARLGRKPKPDDANVIKGLVALQAEVASLRDQSTKRSERLEHMFGQIQSKFQELEEGTWTARHGSNNSEAQAPDPAAIDIPDDRQDTAAVLVVSSGLTLIEGLAPEHAERLKAAGIVSLSDLAAATPRQLYEIIQPASWQTIDAERWIRQANHIARGA